MTVLEHDGEATSLLTCLEGAAAVYLVDACVSDAPAGKVQRFDAARAPLPQVRFGLSSHAFGLAEGIELARALDRLPARCVVFAVEAASFMPGDSLSPPVAAAVESVCRALQAETSV